MTRITPGLALAATGCFHVAVGAVMGAEPLAAIVADGVLGAVPDTAPWRMSIFWFQFFGLLLILQGATWHWMQRQHIVMPRWMGGATLAICILGIVCMPISGFWLAAAVSVAAMRANRPVCCTAT